MKKTLQNVDHNGQMLFAGTRKQVSCRIHVMDN